MLQLGTKITQPGDPLRKLTVEQLYLMISKPKTESADFIQQLRALAAIDERQYRELKKQLPYFVCGIFQPAIRRKEHFATIKYFILDLDHLSRANVGIEGLHGQLREDDRVMLYFSSPGGDGLKVLFQLSEECRDAGQFSAFYKVFARRIGEQYGLLGVIDPQTHDVTRACFLSADPNTYYNPLATPVDMAAYLKNLDFEDAVEEIRESEKILKTQAPASIVRDTPELDSEILSRIKLRLNPNTRIRAAKQYHVPPQLDEVLPLLQQHLAEWEMEIRSNTPIQYGRKLQVFAGRQFAEINLFFGKKGFTVVKTTKTGSNPDLASLVVQAIEQILETI